MSTISMRDEFKGWRYHWEPRDDARFATWEPELADDDKRLTYSEWHELWERSFMYGVMSGDDEEECVEWLTRLVEFEDNHHVAAALFHLRARAEAKYVERDGGFENGVVCVPDDAWLEQLSRIDPYAAEDAGFAIALGAAAFPRDAVAGE